jgi:hypothetical protein
MSAEAAAGEPAERARESVPPKVVRSRWWWLPRPILLTLFGAAISAWLIPAVTRQWQDRQKEREIKVALVSDIGDSASDALVTSQYVANRAFPGGNGQAEYNRFSLDWARRSAQIEAKLRAYFPDDPLVDDWKEYSIVVQNDFYLLTGGSSGKAAAVHTVRQYLDPAPGGSEALADVNWKRLRSLNFDNQPAVGDYVLVTEQLLDGKERLIRAILNANAEGFSTTGSDFIDDLTPFT